MSSITKYRYRDPNPLEATMIQGTNVNIVHADMNMTNYQVNEGNSDKRYGACLVAATLSSSDRMIR